MKLSQLMFLSMVTVMSSTAAITTHAATDYPSKPVTLIVPWTAGGAIDMTARHLGEALAKEGVNVIIENLPGASGTIGLNKVARANPDGYTLGIATSSLMGVIAQKITPLTTKDFTALKQVTRDKEILVVPSASTVKTMEDFVSLMKSKPGGVSIANPGTYTINHVYAALLEEAVGTEVVHVPYTGSAKVIVDLIGHQVDAAVVKPSEIMGNMESGTIRVIGTFAKKRSEALPDVPTFEERGLDVFSHGEPALIAYVVGPRNMPSDLSAKLAGLLDRAVMNEEYQAFAKKNGMRGDRLQGAELNNVIEEVQDVYNVVLEKLSKQ